MYEYADLDTAGRAFEAGQDTLTIVASPEDGLLWYSRSVWRDATFAWKLQRHTKDGFHRLTDELRVQLPAEVGTFTPGENATYVDPWYDPNVANRDANGRDLGYPGPDGKALYFRGIPVGTAADWERIQQEER